MLQCNNNKAIYTNICTALIGLPLCIHINISKVFWFSLNCYYAVVHTTWNENDQASINKKRHFVVTAVIENQTREI